MPLRTSEGLLYLILYRSSHVVAAFKEARSIMESYVLSKEKLDSLLLESARSSLIFELIEKEKSVSDVSIQSLLFYYKGVGQDFTKSLLKKIASVSLDDLSKVGPAYVRPLFDSSISWTAVCCHPSKVEEVVSGFKELSKEFTVLKSLEDSFLTAINVA
jgi:Zn-dependent M16 (insulinase) family peptidase